MKVSSTTVDSARHVLQSIPRVGVKSRTPSESRKLIQKQLILLLHANHCLKKREGCSSKEEGSDQSEIPVLPKLCNIPHCDTMQQVWIHMRTCRDGPSCTALHCASSLKILAHWRNCTSWNCAVCHLIRLKLQGKRNATGQQPAVMPAVSGGGLLMIAPQAMEQASVLNLSVNKSLDAKNSSASDFHMTSSNQHTEMDKSPIFPSFGAVKRAYEELGIPCPPEALQRLMRTLPIPSSHLRSDSQVPNDKMSANLCLANNPMPIEDEGYSAGNQSDTL